MKKITFELDQEFIRLCDLLKVNGLADSGAQGKHLVADGLVRVDGAAESRKTAKIRPGQTVECHGTHIVVKAAAPGKAIPAAVKPAMARSSVPKPAAARPGSARPGSARPKAGKNAF